MISKLIIIIQYVHSWHKEIEQLLECQKKKKWHPL